MINTNSNTNNNNNSNSNSNNNIQKNIDNNEVITFSKILLINEIFNKKENQKENLSIRVLGSLKEVDIGKQLAIIEFEGYSILTTLDLFISNIPSKLNCYYQFIGELIKPNIKQKEFIEERKLFLNENINQEFILNSRVYKLVDGIDINLYKESLSVKRKFETQFKNNK